MKSEKFNEFVEITRNFKNFNKPYTSGGPIVLNYRGKNYYDDSEGHIEVDGRTGTGKTTCVSTPFAITCLKSGESLIAIDPKGDLYKNTAYLAENTHNIKVFNFRNPSHSPDKWNPLYSPLSYYKSGDPELVDIAYEMITAMSADNIYPVKESVDPFWPQSAAEFFTGIVLSLFDIASNEEINIDSVANIMIQAETKIGPTTLIKEYAESFPDNSMVKRYLNTYISAPNETRGSIHSFASNGLSTFARSRGLMQMLSQDTVDINNLDIDKKPLAIYIILPENSVYSPLAALLFSQLTKHFMRLAHKKYNGKLPSRINLILEELSSVGSALPNLDELMVSARSRNIRLMLILQNGHSQLTDLYGSSKAATINSCVGVTYAFSTNNWDTLKELSERCGNKSIEINGHIEKEPLITPTQLAAMETRQCLVMIDNGRYKYITKFPFYFEMFDMGDWHTPISISHAETTSVGKVFEFKKYVENLREKKINAMLNRPSPNPFNTPSPMPPSDINVDELVKRIDEKIAELEAEEDEENKANISNENDSSEEILDDEFITGPSITILKFPKSAFNEVLNIYATLNKLSLQEARTKIQNTKEPIVLKFDSFFEMLEMHEKLSSYGVRCIIDD